MNTAAGQSCAVSGKRIQSMLDGKYCQICQAAFHNDVLEGVHCPRCGRRFKETADKLDIVSIKDLNSESAKSSARFNRRLAITAIVLCLLPFAIALARLLLAVDRHPYDGSVNWRHSLMLVGRSWLQLCWPFSAGCAIWALLHALVRRHWRNLPIAAAAIGFGALAAFFTYLWIIVPVQKEVRRKAQLAVSEPPPSKLVTPPRKGIL